MTRTLGVGIIGCGNISTTYFTLAPLFRGLEVRACADINMAAAAPRADGIQRHAPQTVEDLLANPDIDIVVNLTIPDAHFTVSLARPRGRQARLFREAARPVARGGRDAARARRRPRASASARAPDTFLGGAHQQARSSIDEGAIGTVIAGTAHVMSHGMEHWHPNPGLLLPARRRPDPRPRPLLHRQPRST